MKIFTFLERIFGKRRIFAKMFQFRDSFAKPIFAKILLFVTIQFSFANLFVTIPELYSVQCPLANQESLFSSLSACGRPAVHNASWYYIHVCSVQAAIRMWVLLKIC